MHRELMRKNEIPIDDEETSVFMYVLSSIYMYLFIIVLAIVMAINTMVESWEKDILGSVTIQVSPIEDDNKKIDTDKTQEQLNKVLQFMENADGVKSVNIIDEKTIERLMTPWLGNKVDINSLPIPQLLDVQLKDNAEINYDEMTRGLHKVTPNASIDNHRLWLNRLLKFAGSLKTLALSVLCMVIGICAFSIYYSTRTSLGINLNSIEILHIIGAQDKYIAKQYAKSYAKIGFFSGVIGLIFAIPSIILVSKYGISTGSGLLNSAGLSTFHWLFMMITPLFSLFYAMGTAYYTVRRSLEKMC
ncbi:MAG: FtsX-like permease family protein [Alphaproteobacteria bacterium]|nr:FtsX-like permease family protein [Alphaproteobacteria bacterium]